VEKATGPTLTKATLLALSKRNYQQSNLASRVATSGWVNTPEKPRLWGNYSHQPYTYWNIRSKPLILKVIRTTYKAKTRLLWKENYLGSLGAI